MFQTRPGAQLLLGSVSGAEQTLFTNAHNEKKTGRSVVRFGSPMFASVTSSLYKTVGQPGKDEKTRQEPATSLEYPHEFCFSGHCPTLLGMGVRSKKLFGIKNINVYALGVYVDEAAAKKSLSSKFKNSDSSSLATNQDLFDSLIAADNVQKTLSLKIAFGALRRSQFLDALAERLEPPLKQAGAVTALDDFKKQFDGVNFHKGMEIAFTQQGANLVTCIDGVEVGKLSSKALSKALWGIYLGPDPVSPGAKETLGTSLAAALKHH